MRRLILIILTLVLGLVLGPLIQTIPGTLVLIFEQYSLQFRLWQGLVMLGLAVLIFAFVYHLIVRLVNTAGRFQRWSGNRNFNKARQKTIQGMIALSEGRWAKAEKLLSESASKTDTALINYLAAAQAAEAQHAHERRDQYLRLAHLAEPSAEIAVGLTQSQLQLRHGQIEEALAGLSHLQRLSPKHGPILRLLAKVYGKLGEWQRVIDLLPELKKSGAIVDDEREQLTVTAWRELLNQQATSHGAEGVQTIWNTIPRKLQHNQKIERQFYSLLIKTGANLEAAKGLSQRIKKVPEEPLLELYGIVDSGDSAQQLKLVESLGEKFNHSYQWYLTAGKLALRCHIWGQAKNYLQQADNLKSSPEAKQLLAVALDAMGMNEEAYQQMKQSWPEEYQK